MSLVLETESQTASSGSGSGLLFDDTGAGSHRFVQFVGTGDRVSEVNVDPRLLRCAADENGPVYAARCIPFLSLLEFRAALDRTCQLIDFPLLT